MSIYDEIEMKLEELRQIDNAAEYIRTVMSDPNSTDADVRAAIQSGIETLNSIETKE